MKDLTVSPTITIKQAMKKLDHTAEKCLLVVDEELKLLGTLTDGDLRRSILKGKKFSENIESCFNSEPTTLQKQNYSDKEAKKLLRDKKLDLIPVVDKERIVVDYFTWTNLGEKEQKGSSLKNIPVIVMAGGKGTRLEPFTKILPKPLVPINEKPIIEHIIGKFTDVGCNDFYLTVNYKGKILKAYFEELTPQYNVNFIDEPQPLGTAGSLRYLAGRFSEPFFVTNCDIIIRSDYNELYQFHINNGFDITLVASAKDYIIPYGTCELNDDGYLSHINEKPKYEFLINTGLYIINPDILAMIPENEFFHITQLIEAAKNVEKKIGVFPVDEDAWVDVGQWVEYRTVVDKFQ